MKIKKLNIMKYTIKVYFIGNSIFINNSYNILEYTDRVSRNRNLGNRLLCYLILWYQYLKPI